MVIRSLSTTQPGRNSAASAASGRGVSQSAHGAPCVPCTAAAPASAAASQYLPAVFIGQTFTFIGVSP